MTAGALVFRSGYATYARTVSLPFLILTHSPWVVTGSSERAVAGCRPWTHIPAAPVAAAISATTTYDAAPLASRGIMAPPRTALRWPSAGEPLFASLSGPDRYQPGWRSPWRRFWLARFRVRRGWSRPSWSPRFSHQGAPEHRPAGP